METIYQLIPKVMKAIGAIGKDRKNEAQGYKFRGIEDIYNAAHPALISAGVFCVPQVTKCESTDRMTKSGAPSIRVTLTVCHKFYGPLGDCVDVITCGEGIDSSDKATNKAMSAAMKYAFVELLSLPFAEVEDSDRDNPESGLKKLNVPRTTEAIQIKPEVKSERIVAPESDRITTDQAQKLHVRFKQELRKDLQSQADPLLYDWLGSRMYLDEHGNPSAASILKTEFAEVGKAAVQHARELS